MHNKSLCPNKDECGSCSWSHIPYEKQLEQKLADINGSFRIHEVSLACPEILPSPKTSHYRNRMDFAIDFQGRVGLRAKGKWWKVLDGHHCFISDSRIEELFAVVREWVGQSGLSYFDRKRHDGLLRYAVIRATQTGETLLSIITSAPNSDEENQCQEALLRLQKQIPATHLVWSIADTISDVSRGDRILPLQHSPYIVEQIGSYSYEIHPFTFFQTNSQGAELLQQTVLDFAGPYTGGHCIDLYCGSGFFTIPLATQFSSILGVELEEEAIIRARRNAEINGIQAEFIAAKTEEFEWTKQHSDLVVLDPPRAGLHDKAIRQVETALPSAIIYVSCNFKAFAREMKILSTHYRVERMRAIDMFPHTPHVELVSLLVRKE